MELIRKHWKGEMTADGMSAAGWFDHWARVVQDIEGKGNKVVLFQIPEKHGMADPQIINAVEELIQKIVAGQHSEK